MGHRPIPVFFYILVGIYSGVLRRGDHAPVRLSSAPSPQALVTLSLPYGMTTFITARFWICRCFD